MTRIATAIAIAACAWATIAIAQSPPAFVPPGGGAPRPLDNGDIPTATQWNNFFESKQDYGGGGGGCSNCLINGGPLGTPSSGNLANTSGFPASGLSGTVLVPQGGTGQNSFVTGGPLLGNGANALTQGTISGSSTALIAKDGAFTNGHCPQIDAAGGLVDSGGACASGGGAIEYQSTVYSLNLVPGIDCTGATDSSAALNAIFSSINGRHIRLINTSNSACHMVVYQQLQVLSATEWWIDGDSNAAGNANAGFTISGCGTPTSPLGGHNALFYINASYHWRMTNLSLEVNGGSKCSSASTFTTGIQRDNAGGSYTSTDSVIDNVSVTANFSGSSAVSGFKGIIDTATSANGENFRILNSYVFCQANTNGVGIQFLGRFADLGELHHNYIGGSNNAGCYRAIEDNASQLRVENNFGGNETGGYSIFGAGGAFFYLDACPTGFQSLSIIGNETDTSGPFFSNNGDTANAGCGNGVVRIDGNEVGSSDMAANTPAINVGNANNDPSRPGVFYVTNNVLNNNAANSFPMIGSYSTQPNVGSLIAWGNFRVDGNPVYMTTGNFSGGSGSAVVLPETGFLESSFTSQGTNNDFYYTPDNLGAFGNFTGRSAATIYQSQTAVTGVLHNYLVYSYLANQGVSGSPLSTFVLDAENGTGQVSGSVAIEPPLTGAVNIVATSAQPNITANTVTNVGTAGAATVTYKLVGVGGAVCTTAASAAMTTTTANATLNSTNYNSLLINTNDFGLIGYKVYRTAGGPSQGLIGWVPVVNSTTSRLPVPASGNIAAGNGQQITFHDTGLAGDSTSPPTASTCTGALSTASQTITANGLPIVPMGFITPTNASGLITTTTGTIASTSNSLAVGSTAGWIVGEGIEIPGAGAAGVLLLTTVTGISSGHLAVAATASTTATGVTVQHDDTAALVAALATGSNVWVPPGNYNIYAASGSALNIAAAQWLQCSGNGAGSSSAKQTIIWNRGSTNNSIIMTAGGAHFSDCGLIQAADVTPSAGNLLALGNGGNITSSSYVERNYICCGFGLLNVNGVAEWNVSDNQILTGTHTSTVVTVNNASPNGDVKFIGNTIQDGAGNNLTCLSFTTADTDMWVWNKFADCGTFVSSASSSVHNQNFVANSFENASGATPMIALSAGSSFMFTGNQFGVDHGHGVFGLSGTVSNVSIVGNILTNAVSGTPYADTSSGTNINYVGNTDTNNPTFSSFNTAIFAEYAGLNWTTLTPGPISGLQTCNAGFAGSYEVVNNGIASPTYHQAVSSTGAATWPVFCNGSAWVYD